MGFETLLKGDMSIEVNKLDADKYYHQMITLKKMQDFFELEGIIIWNGVQVLKLLPRDENSLCSHILSHLKGFMYCIHPAENHGDKTYIFVQVDKLFNIWCEYNQVSLEKRFLKELKRP